MTSAVSKERRVLRLSLSWRLLKDRPPSAHDYSPEHRAEALGTETKDLKVVGMFEGSRGGWRSSAIHVVGIGVAPHRTP
jgi:hypothetical protein